MNLRTRCYQELKFLINQRKKLAEDPFLILSLNLEEKEFLIEKENIIERIEEVQKKCDHPHFVVAEVFSLKRPLKGFKKQERECSFCAKILK